MIKREFKPQGEYTYRRKGTVGWVISHVIRYPLLPLILLLSAVANNIAYSNIQVFVGKAFDVISQTGFETSALLAPVLIILVSALGEGIGGIVRSFSGEFLAQKIERRVVVSRGELERCRATWQVRQREASTSLPST